MKLIRLSDDVACLAENIISVHKVIEVNQETRQRRESPSECAIRFIDGTMRNIKNLSYASAIVALSPTVVEIQSGFAINPMHVVMVSGEINSKLQTWTKICMFGGVDLQSEHHFNIVIDKIERGALGIEV